jgi:hypothetical protein
MALADAVVRTIGGTPAAELQTVQVPADGPAALRDQASRSTISPGR